MLELPLLLPNPLLHIATQSCVVPDDDDDENELVPDRPHFAAKFEHACAQRLLLVVVVKLLFGQPDRPAPRATNPQPRDRPTKNRRILFTVAS